jgi:hypothetical protein
MIQRLKKIFLLLLFFLFSVYGQNSESTIQNWFDFTASYTFDKQWKAYGDAGYRIIINENILNRFYIRPAASLHVSEVLTLHAGFGLFTSFVNDINVLESRPFQGVEINWPVIFSIPLTNYIRFEERFFSSNASNKFVFRWRYQLGTRIRFDEDKIEKIFYIPLQLEWFANYNRDFDFIANEFRAITGLGYTLDKSWRFEINTILQNSQATLDEIYNFYDMIFRLRAFRQFNL